MADLLMHSGLLGNCPHGAPVQATAGSARVSLGGQPALRSSDACLVSGCPFIIALKPQPCVSVQWLVAATRVRIEQQPALLLSSTGLCKSGEQIPQGPPIPIPNQFRVKGV